MRILQVITGMQKAAGTSVFCGEVCNGLVAHGHDVTLAVGDVANSEKFFPTDSRVEISSIASIVGYAKKFDVVHIHGIWSPILHRVVVWAAKSKMPIVWSPHGMLAPWAMRHKWWKKWLPWHLYQKRDLKLAKMLHATSQQELGWIRGLGFTQPITIAPLGTHLPSMKPGVAKREKVLLFVGRIYPVKALDRLIQAFAMVPLEVRREWRLRLVGPDQAGHQECLEAIVKSLELDGRVGFAGPKFGEALNAEYDACDCLALVSHTENFGATVVDAMAHGKPVITSDKTPWQEVPTLGCGWWVSNEVAKLSVAICEMMNLSDVKRRQMGECGRKLVKEKYTWDVVVEKMIVGYGGIKNEDWYCNHTEVQ